jgi:hypothetical protein
MLEFVVKDYVRNAFGFVNQNHAAAAICALFQFCCGGSEGDCRKQHEQR